MILKRTLAAAALAVCATLALAPLASADPVDPNDPYGFNAYRDRTNYFVGPLDPGALIGPNTNKPIIISPFGTSRKIECRGDGHYVWIHDCRQYDANNNAHELRLLANPIRPIYLYI